MKETIEHSIKICIDAINNAGNGADAVVLQLIRTLAPLPYQGAGLGIGTEGYRGYRPSSKGLLMRLVDRKAINNQLSWESALLFLYDAANMDEAAILSSAKSIEDDIIYNHILEHIISNLAEKNDISRALQFIPNFRTTTIFQEENNRDRGYLILLRYYAAQGDPTLFFNYFKLAEPRKNKTELANLKSYLVESFAKKRSLMEAIELCKHKNLGEKYYSSALFGFAKTGKYAELKSVFEKHPELKQTETELGLLSTAYLEAKKNKYLIEDDFDSLFERALMLSRKIKSGAATLQDAVLFDLGLAEYENKERREKCRKAIKSNSIKKELNAYPIG
jgi:hypothetical protein